MRIRHGHGHTGLIRRRRACAKAGRLAPARRDGEDQPFALVMKLLVTSAASAWVNILGERRSVTAVVGKSPAKVKEQEPVVETTAAKAAGTKEAKDVGRIVDAVAVEIRTQDGGITIRGIGDRRRITTQRAGTPRQRL